MGKNGQIHVYIETELQNQIKQEAQGRDISLSELIRCKLRAPIAKDELLLLSRLLSVIKKEMKDG